MILALKQMHDSNSLERSMCVVRALTTGWLVSAGVVVNRNWKAGGGSEDGDFDKPLGGGNGRDS